MISFAMSRNERDRVRGLHAGIPACCIQFFVSVWLPFMQYRRYGRSYFRTVWAWTYIPCLECSLRRKIVHVRRCSCQICC